MDLAPLITAIGGGVTLTGALILALVRYLTSDGSYRDLIAELRKDNEDLRRQVATLSDEVRLLRAQLAGPSWPPPKGSP